MFEPLMPISSNEVSPNAMSFERRMPTSVLSSDSTLVGVFWSICSLVIDRTL